MRHSGSTPSQSQILRSYHKLPDPEIDVQVGAVLCLKFGEELLNSGLKDVAGFLGFFLHILQSVIGTEDYFKGSP